MGWVAHIHSFGIFWLGVFGWIGYRIRQTIRWLAYEEGLIEHFFRRFVAVERRLRGVHHLTFVYRFLRYAIHHYRLIPSWMKLAKLLVILAITLGHPIWEQYSHGREYNHYYAFYYQHGLEHYRQYLPEKEAVGPAENYARRFAEYYTSSAYKQALRNALPEAPDNRMEQAAQQAPEAVRVLRMADVGFDLIRHFEGLRLKPYRDPAGKFTIGYGHLLRPGEALSQIGRKRAEALLRSDVAIAELIVKQYVRVPLTVSQFSALTALVYNIGGYQFRNSTLLRLINTGNYTGAAEEIRRWERAGGRVLRGLTRRRQAEYLLFTGKWRVRKTAMHSTVTFNRPC